MENLSGMRNHIAIALALLAAVTSLAAAAVMMPGDEHMAYADELSDAKEELSAQVGKLDELTTRIEELDTQIDEKANAAIELEGAIAEKQESISELAVFFYKHPSTSLLEYVLASENISQMLTRAEFLYDYTEELARMTREQREMDATLHSEIESISTQKDEQVAAQEELKGIVSELQAKVSKLTSEQLAKLAAGSTFATNFDDGAGGWITCQASAYGGATDPMTPNPSRTATGTICNDSSMGVAIPMRWPNFRSYFGRKLEISYGGKSIITTVQDCGGMQGNRHLDLMPGIWRAFGATSCNSWGVRTVQYRWL